MSEIKKIKILVVDDSANMRAIVRRHLLAMKDFSWEILEAGNGEAALSILQDAQIMENPIHLIILDWMMPKVSGLEFLKRIRGSETFNKKPNVIMLTAETYPDQIAACKEHNVEVYLTKPFTEEELRQAIQKVIAIQEVQNAA